jgi:L-lysine 2,3-aminomutase
LKDVNDNPRVLADLMKKLVSLGVIPYYIFQCRPVRGVVENFQVPLVRGYKIIESTKSLLNGPCKRFRYVLSHEMGKLELIGLEGRKAYFRFHESRHKKNDSRIITKFLTSQDGWI